MKLPSRIVELIRELRRRRVLQAAAVYATGAFVAIQVATNVFPALQFPPWTQTLVVVVAIAGFPVVVALWWAFEITPEGISRTVEREEGAEVIHARGTPWVALVLVGVVAIASAGIGWAAWDLWLDPGSDVRAAGDGSSDDLALPIHRVAVLPFQVESPDSDGGLKGLAGGLSDDLYHQLTQIDTLDVVWDRGAKSFRDMDLEAEADSVAREMGAGSLVSGSVQGMGDSVRVRVRLVDGRDGVTQMSREFTEPRDSVLVIRDHVVDEAVRQLRRQIGEEVDLEETRGGTSHSRAWQLYNEAERIVQRADTLRHARATALAERYYDRADSLYRAAHRIDPDWAAPTIARGWVAYRKSRLAGPEIRESDPEWLRRGVGIADSVLADHPGNAAALELRGVLRSLLCCYLGDVDSLKEAAEKDLLAAVTADRPRTWVELADFYRLQGEFEQAETHWEQARKADAFLSNDADILRIGSIVALELGKVGTALELAKRGQERYPSTASFAQNRLLVYPTGGAPRVPPDTLWAVLREFEERVGGSRAYARVWVAAALARLGLADSARSVLRRTLAEASERQRVRMAYYAPKVWLNLGDTARAVQGLREAMETEYWAPRRDYLAQDIWWEPLHGDSAFQALVAGEVLPGRAGRPDSAEG